MRASLKPRLVDLHLPARHEAQERIVREGARYNVLCCGRRFGKDVLGIDMLVDTAVEGQPCAWFAPTYKQMIEVWRTLADTLAPVTRRRSEQEHRLELITNGVIDMWSLDSPDTARGRAYKRVVVNEAAQVAGLTDAWQMIIRPTLTDYAGDAWFLSTPRGFNFFHTLYLAGQDPQQTEWRSWRFPTSVNPFISPAELAAARAELPARVWAQEYEADFVGSAGCIFEVERITEYREQCRPPIETSLNGALRIWQRPKPLGVYVAGADVAEGKDAGDNRYDYSGVAIYDWQTCAHVADLHGQWPVDEFARLSDTLCRSYNNALMGVERNNHGHAVLLALKQLGYPNVYQHDESDDLAARQGVRRLVAGWPTTAKTKPVMQQELAALITSGGIVSYDEALWDECLSYVRHGNGSTGAQDGCHDDRVVKAMIALQMRKHVQLPGVRQGLVAGRIAVGGAGRSMIGNAGRR